MGRFHCFGIASVVPIVSIVILSVALASCGAEVEGPCSALAELDCLYEAACEPRYFESCGCACTGDGQCADALRGSCCTFEVCDERR